MRPEGFFWAPFSAAAFVRKASDATFSFAATLPARPCAKAWILGPNSSRLTFFVLAQRFVGQPDLEHLEIGRRKVEPGRGCGP